MLTGVGTAAAPLAAAALLLVSVSGCGSQDVSAGGPGGQGPALVRVGPVEQRSVSPKVTIVGSVVPRRTSIVASGNQGIVEKFPVEEGQFVREGTVLSELRMVTTNLEIQQQEAVLQERKRQWEELLAGYRQEEIDEAEAKMLAAEAVMKNTASKLQRARDLFEKGAINQDDLDDAIERADAARQTYLAAKATFARFQAGPRQEQIDQAEARYKAQQKHVAFLKAEKEKRITRAPFDGFIVKEHTYRGQWLSKGDPVVALARLDEVDVVANVDQHDERHVKLGETAAVRIAGAEPEEWTGTIVAKVPRSEWEQGSRGFPVKVRLENRLHEVDGQKLPVLKEGMMAEATFTGEPVDAVLISKDALVRTSRGTLIYVFDPMTLPKWSVRSAGEAKGDIFAADEKDARGRAQERFGGELADDFTVEVTARPLWEVSVEKDGQKQVLAYLEADSREQARRQAAAKTGDVPAERLQLRAQTGSVRRMQVELGISDGVSIQVLGETLQPGQFVVVEGAERLHDYQEVRLPQQKISQPDD